MLRIAILILALGSGGTAAFMTYSASGPEPTPEPAAVVVEKTPETHVLVARSDVQRAERLTEADLEWRPWPAENLSDTYIDRSSRPDARKELAGRMARGALVAGEPILEGKLMETGTSFLSTLLGPGERAVAVPISAEKTAGGFILPGDRVDVLHSDPSGLGGTGPSRAILQNVEVLAIDQSLEDEDDDSNARVGQTATLRVDLAQAERLGAAQIVGELTLALRASADNDAPVSQVETLANAEARPSIRIRRAGEVEEVTLE